jgi:hypothetical protein
MRMKKLELRIEALEVESFSTHGVEPAKGTVLAYGNSGDSCNTRDAFTCQLYATCNGGGTCNGEGTCDRNCLPQQPQWWIDQGGDPTPCCTAAC